MLSVPYSRYILGPVPWYSFLIVLGAVLAIILAIREEKRGFLEKDTVIDFSLIVLPCGILGARIYYVIFSWDMFKNDPVSIIRIWEGGIAIYGGIISGLLTAVVFSRVRHISFLTLCDVIAPGLVLAQSLGRWGNYFNQEAFGLPVENPDLCFFPFAVQILEPTGPQWHMATFFYESLWNLLVFFFLLIARRKWFRYKGDVFSFYALLYACGRLIIEDLRMDSLYASSTIRISQLLSVFICMFFLLYYFRSFSKKKENFPSTVKLLLAVSLLVDIVIVLMMTNIIPFADKTVTIRFLILLFCSVINMAALFLLYGTCAEGDLIYADNPR